MVSLDLKDQKVTQDSKENKELQELLVPAVHQGPQEPLEIRDQVQRERKETLELKALVETKVTRGALEKKDLLGFLELLDPMDKKETRAASVQLDLQVSRDLLVPKELKDLKDSKEPRETKT